MNDLRWFAPNPYASLIVPKLRRRGLSIALDGSDPARLALAMSATVATQAWRIEALASGTPVVASDIPPHREFGGHAATYFPLDDDEALVTAVATALDSTPPNPAVLRDLSIPSVAERFEALLRPLLR